MHSSLFRQKSHFLLHFLHVKVDLSAYVALLEKNYLEKKNYKYHVLSSFIRIHYFLQKDKNY